MGILPPIAAIGMSLAGFAGLIAALLKRGEVWRPGDLFLLRQVVSYGFAAVLFALSPVPLAGLLGTERAIQTISIVLLPHLLRGAGRDLLETYSRRCP